MQLKINGQPVDVTLENEKTVGDVLKSFESEAAKNDATTVAIWLNGREISADKFDDAAAEALTDNTEIDLNVISKHDIIESFKDIAAQFSSLTEKLNDVPVQLQSGKDREASATITALATEVDTFCHMAALSALFPDLYNALIIDGKNLNDFFKEFSPILSDFESAMEVKDTVTVGDLSEYEIGPRLKSISEVLTKFN
ncbi:MAG: hypothetical protein II187_01970 [Treponema sp.]|jgi:hypothetical protein|nr:hypothetical protein [Treponema sp.]